MKRSFIFLLFVAVTTFFSCDDTTDSIGMSLTEITDNLSVDADTFFVESHSVAAQNIVSHSSTGYLGKIKDPETGSYVTCNYMTQFNPMGEYQFPVIDSLYTDDFDQTIPFAEQVEADSCELIVYFHNFYGDSLALMKVVAHELATPYEEARAYKTDFDPKREGMIRTGQGSVHSEMSYTVSNRLHAEDYRESGSYKPYISFSLNDEYTDKDGVTYNNYGTYLMRKFYNSATNKYFGNNYLFNHNICPGFYIENVGGLGSLGTITITQIIVYFKGRLNGKSAKHYTSFAGTEEVLQKTTIKQNTPILDQLVRDNSCTYLKTPAGIYTELTLPIDRIMQGRDNDVASHENDTLNTVRLFIPRINDKASTQYNLSVPKEILMIPTDSINDFFANRKVADSRTTYLTQYDSSTNGYTFGNISLLVTQTYRALNDTITKVLDAKKAALGVTELPADLKKTLTTEVTRKYKADHPTWNKVTLIPVETTYSTLASGSSVLTKVAYDLNLRSTRLLKGTADAPNITVSVIYSRFED